MKAKEIIDLMDKWALPELIDTWDNTGFQIGDENQNVKKILIALDLDQIVCDKAIKENFQMIITHHPLIFKPLDKITSEDNKEKMILDLIKNDIVVYNAHSNLDLADNGINDVLAEKLKIKNLKPLTNTFKDRLDPEKYYGYGRVGDIEETKILGLIDQIKNRLNLEHVIIYGDVNRLVSKIAICGGSGSDFISDAHRHGAEVYITGDIKYHDGQLAHELGLTLIDAGHYSTEKIILPIIKEYLNNNLQNKVEIEVIYESSLPYQIF